MPPLVNDHGFPQLRKDMGKSRRIGLADDGMTDGGTIIPGILNMGRILDTSRFSGLPRTDGEKYGIWDPTNGADIIVTILYQHSRSVLAQFLSCDDTAHFKYEHLHSAKSRNGALGDFKSFEIIRNGDKVQAGFRDGHVQGTVAKNWHDVVRYTILMSGQWRQDLVKFTPGIHVDSESLGPAIVSLCRDDGRESRVSFERDAVRVLKPAIISRRWFRRPGFKIRVTLTEHQDQGVADQGDEGGTDFILV